MWSCRPKVITTARSSFRSPSSWTKAFFGGSRASKRKLSVSQLHGSRIPDQPPIGRDLDRGPRPGVSFQKTKSQPSSPPQIGRSFDLPRFATPVLDRLASPSFFVVLRAEAGTFPYRCATVVEIAWLAMEPVAFRGLEIGVEFCLLLCSTLGSALCLHTPSRSLELAVSLQANRSTPSG